MSTELYGAAYRAAANTYTPELQAQAKAKLSGLFPDASSGRISQAFEAARALGRIADWTAAQNREGTFTDDQALACLQKECPGFTEDTYDRALGQGWVDNR